MVTNKIKEQFADIVAAKDAKKLRTFVAIHREVLADELIDKILRMTQEELVNLMTYWGATQMVFAPYWEKNRNILRTETLEKEFGLASEDLKTYIRDSAGRYPLCQECRWFRNTPPKEKDPCIHLGAVPTDIACGGWTKIGAGDDISSPSEGSRAQAVDSISHGGISSGQSS